MANRTVTLTGQNVGADVATVDIYHTSVEAGNVIASNVTKEELEAGYSFVDDDARNTYIITADSPCGTTATVTFDVLEPTLTPTTSAPKATATVFYRSGGQSETAQFCANVYTITATFYGFGAAIPELMGTTIYTDRDASVPFVGNNLFYAVSTRTGDSTGTGNEPFYAIQVAADGQVVDVLLVNDCAGNPGGGQL